MPLKSERSSKVSSQSKRRLVFDDASDSEEPDASLASSRTESSPKPPLKKRAKVTSGPISLSTPSKRKTKSAVVTPGDIASDEATTTVAASEYVPKYIHQNLNYRRMGQAKIPEHRLKAFKLITDYFVIPSDLEQSRSHGPLSGSSFEDRVIQEYTLGKLATLDSSQSKVEICTACAVVGHMQDDCPTLV